ncbi:hypothetical protein [Piscinibacter sp. HJYY11]|uniref:hypothetical protein n=1 Tax=Piscinibacter sp. HJYY11 TaxID=2801333 RepID=UPI00191D6B4C|nr:hypothetical protein [Piscinibacter sp. HJYY11]MBL0728922.1 hypothetical protein [Piscinibacter sp. HJYY11]
MSSRTLSSASGQPVVGATVTVGGNTQSTGTDGAFSFLNVTQTDRLAVTLSAPGYIPNVRYTASVNNIDTVVPVQLTPVATTQSVDAAVGGTVISSATAQVNFPANAIVTSGGAAPSTAVSVQVTPINVAQDPTLLTGDYRVSANTWLQVHGAMSVVITDGTGGSYDIAPGQNATLRIPVSTRSANRPPVAGLFRFEPTTGFWVNEGTATLTGVGPNQYYAGTVTRSGTWVAGTLPDTVQVTGCVVNTLGERVSRARVESEGVNYSGMTSTLTDSNGNFSIAMRADAESILSARWGRRISNYLEIETEKLPQTISAGCLVLADAISIRLTWGTHPLDVDSHLITPHGTHVSYLNLGSLPSLPYAALDHDDTDSNGPEIVSVRQVVRGGIYRYYVANYSRTYTPAMTGSPVRIEITAGGHTRIFTPPAGEGFNDYWHAFDIAVDSDCNISVNATSAPNIWVATPPGAPTQTLSGPITYCPNI